jgi:hypothetical protein
MILTAKALKRKENSKNRLTTSFAPPRLCSSKILAPLPAKQKGFNAQIVCVLAEAVLFE